MWTFRLSSLYEYGPSIYRLLAIVYNMELDVGSHPGLGVYTQYLKSRHAKLLEQGTYFSYSTNDCGHRFIER